VSLRGLFLWEQVRDLWAQEFLRELIVGVAAPSNLTGSFLVKILHGGEGGNVEQVARPMKQIPRVCDCLSLSIVFISYLHLLLHLYMLDIPLCFIDIYAWDYLLTLVFN